MKVQVSYEKSQKTEKDKLDVKFNLYQKLTIQLPVQLSLQAVSQQFSSFLESC